MPKNKSKQQSATAATDDGDFDKMLAEVTAADSQLSAETRTQTTDIIGRSSSSSSAHAHAKCNSLRGGNHRCL
jgi:hypothetical protein